MARMTYLNEEIDRNKFAEEAGEDFSKHPEHCSFGDVTPGSFLALRWGLGNDCVLVLKLDENSEPVNYQNLVKKIQKGGIKP
jgi:hypothetical protein